MKYIPLTKGRCAIVDEEDFENVSKYRWSFSSTYVMRQEKKKTIYLHRFIISPKKGQYIDHIDHNPLNNCRSNLRICTMSQNMMNQAPQKGKRFKGVHFHRQNKRWVAYISLNRKRKHIGSFATIEDAAKAYDSVAKSIFGNFAYLNFK